MSDLTRAEYREFLIAAWNRAYTSQPQFTGRVTRSAIKNYVDPYGYPALSFDVFTLGHANVACVARVWTRVEGEPRVRTKWVTAMS